MDCSRIKLCLPASMLGETPVVTENGCAEHETRGADECCVTEGEPGTAKQSGDTANVIETGVAGRRQARLIV